MELTIRTAAIIPILDKWNRSPIMPAPLISFYNQSINLDQQAPVEGILTW